MKLLYTVMNDSFHEYDMSTLAEFYSSLSSALTNKTIERIDWNSRGVPVFRLDNNDEVWIYVYVSTSDYDLSVSVNVNEQRHGSYILWQDVFNSSELAVGTGQAVTDASGLNECVGAVISQVAMKGSGQGVDIRLVLSNGQQIQFSTDCGSPDCSVALLESEEP